MRIIINLPARDPSATADVVHHVADQIEAGMTAGILQFDDQRGSWDSEGLSE